MHHVNTLHITATSSPTHLLLLLQLEVFLPLLDDLPPGQHCSVVLISCLQVLSPEPLSLLIQLGLQKKE